MEQMGLICCTVTGKRYKIEVFAEIYQKTHALDTRDASAHVVTGSAHAVVRGNVCLQLEFVTSVCLHVCFTYLQAVGTSRRQFRPSETKHKFAMVYHNTGRYGLSVTGFHFGQGMTLQMILLCGGDRQQLRLIYVLEVVCRVVLRKTSCIVTTPFLAMTKR